MNRPLRRLGAAVLVLFTALLAMANYRQVVQADALRDDPRNRRVLLAEYDVDRGDLLAPATRPGGPAVVLARSVPTTDALTYLRTYPLGADAAHVTGWASFVYGPTSLEQEYDDLLGGTDSALFTRRLLDDLTGRERRGADVVLTLDADAQRAAVRGLAGVRGAVVALDPRTGAVLALASSPSFDPAELSSHDATAIQAAYARLTGDPAEPLLNRATRQTYPPGSTFKVLTAAAALEDGLTPSSRLPAPLRLDLPQTERTLGNFGGKPCAPGGTTTLLDALRVSCNTAFGQLGLDFPDGRLADVAARFGAGAEDLRLGDRVVRSVVPAELTPPQKALAAIGQVDVRTTPLQMAMVAAGVAQAGTVMRPYLVQQVRGPDLTTLRTAQPERYRQAVSPQVAAMLAQMMEAVVSNGSGRLAQLPGVRVAGKTGTAQHAEGKAPHAWFIGFAPADAPRVAVAVLVEEGGDVGSEATGGRVSAPIAREVMRAVLR